MPRLSDHVAAARPGPLIQKRDRIRPVPLHYSILNMYILVCAFEKFRGYLLDFFRGYLFQLCGNPPFMTKRVTNTSESVAPEHIIRLHQQLCPVLHHFFYNLVTIGDVKMNSDSSSTQCSRTGCTSMLRKLVA